MYAYVYIYIYYVGHGPFTKPQNLCRATLPTQVVLIKTSQNRRFDNGDFSMENGDLTMEHWLVVDYHIWVLGNVVMCESNSHLQY